MKKQTKYLSGRFCYKTDIGKVRQTNEDQALALVNARGDILLVVCDGMGGYKRGDLASTIAVDTLKGEFLSLSKFKSKLHASRWLRRVISKANSIIYNRAISDSSCEGMGTTLTCILIVKTFYVIAQIGDSRAYEYKNRDIHQITEDQTYVNHLYKTGQISKEEMLTHPKRHIILNALGAFPKLHIDISLHEYNDENFLLCTDGLYNNVSEMDIVNIARSTDSIEQKSTQLISLSNANGGSDNIGVVIWEAQNNVD